MGEAFLQYRTLRHGYGARVVLDGVDLSVHQGEFIALLGPSGCGKTTLLSLTAGFLSPSAGDIVLQGRSLLGVPAHQRGVGMVFQNYALFPHMTVADNVGFGLRMQRLPRAEIRRRVGEALELVRLHEFAAKYPDALSGGQRQRVALARTLVLRPALLLLDEPLSNLDPSLRAALRDELLRLHRLTGMTTVMVTHDLQEAFSISDRVAVMMQGAVQQYGAPVEVYRRPAHAGVADYFGLGNRLNVPDPGRAAAGVLDLQGAPVHVPEDSREHLVFAVPAHALRLDAEADNRLPGVLTALTYLGASVQFEVDAAGLRLCGEQPAGAWADKLRVGARVTAAWNVADTVVFPREPRHGDAR